MGCLANGTKQQKKNSLQAHLRSLRKSVIATFRANPFNLKLSTARKYADQIMKVIERNHKRARDAGLV